MIASQKSIRFPIIILIGLLMTFHNSLAQSFKNDICFPSEIYLLDSVQNNIFIQPFLKRWRPDNNFVRFSGNIPFLKRVEKMATINNLKQDGLLKIDLYEADSFKIIKTITSNIKVGNIGVGDSNKMFIQIIGDSYTQGCFFKQALLMKNYVPNLQMVGLRKVDSIDNQFHEGRGGWKLNDYFSIITSATKPYQGYYQPQGNLHYWGSTGFWKLVNRISKSPSKNPETNTSWSFNETYGTVGFGEVSSKFISTTGYLIKPQIGDIQYDNILDVFVLFDGKEWKPKDANELSWSFQYDKYLAMWNIEPPQVLFEMLGLNDFRYRIDYDFKNWNAKLIEMKDSYLKAVPNGKFVICIPASSCGILDNDKGDFTLFQNAAMWEVRNNLIKNFDSLQSQGIFLLDVAATIDNENGYNYKNGIQIGNPHPYPNYPTMGIPLAAFIQYHRLKN